MKKEEYVLIEPTGKFFVDPSYMSWSFTDDINNAAKFSSLEEANTMKDTISRAVASTYWDYDDIIPFPKIKEIVNV